MAKITKEEVRLVNCKEALGIIKNADGKVRFSVMVQAFLPVPAEGDKGYNEITFLSVSRTDCLRVVRGLLPDYVEAKGAMIRLHMKPADPDSRYSRASISVY